MGIEALNDLDLSYTFPVSSPWRPVQTAAQRWAPRFAEHSDNEGEAMKKRRVLILCTANSARSQMAEGVMRSDHGDVFEVESAGTRATFVRPEAIAAMKEIGIDISGHRSKAVDEFADQSFDYVLTVCDNANESCPIYPGHANRIHHSFEDPAAVQGSEEERLASFRKVRDEIRAYLRTFPPQAEALSKTPVCVRR